ncbi:MAG: CGNR zinc finger domain-containing protein, partial [Sciscionella sp.]
AAGSLTTAAAGGLEWSWDPSRVSSVRHAIAVSAAELLGATQPQRLKQCPGDHCGWFVLDTTKRGNRRWCSMSTCGQEAKNLRRRKPAPAPAARRAS